MVCFGFGFKHLDKQRLGKEHMMKIGKRSVKVFKMKNRKGYAALCCDHLTEGLTQKQSLVRMEKALARTDRKAKK